MTYYCDIRLSNSRDGGFWVSFPDIKGVYSMGDNKEYTLAMIKEALEGTLEVYLESKFHIPLSVNRSDEGLFPIEVNKDIAKRILTSKIEEFQKELNALEALEEVRSEELCPTC